MALTRITKGVIKPNENYDTHNINSTGIVTAIGLDVNGNGDISGNLSVGGVLTYEDVTSIDSVGIITARGGIDCNGDLHVDGHTNLDNVSISGVTTISSSLNVNDNLVVGNSSNDNLTINAKIDSSLIPTFNNTKDLGSSSSQWRDLYVDGHTNLDNVSVVGVTTFNGDILFVGDNSKFATWDKSDGRFEFFDNAGLVFGNGNDLSILHNGTNSIINNTGGALLFQNNGSSSMYIASDGQVSLNSDITFVGASANALWDKSENYFLIPDKIVHSGDTNTAIRFPGSDIFTIETGGSERVRVDSAGLKILDKLLHFGDIDTAIRFPADDTITAETGGSERLRITDDGRIGINDPSPNDYELDILKRSSATDAQIRLYNNATGSSNDTVMRYQIAGTTANNYIYFGDGDDTNAGQIRYSHNTDSMQFFAGASERLRINSNGDITVISNDAGTTGPTLKLFHNSASPAANDVVSRISMFGDDAAGNETEYGRIETLIDTTTSGQETGYMNFSPMGYSVNNTVFRIKRRGTASAPSYTTDDADGIILDVYNTGNPYPRYMNFIAKASGDTASNIGFWTESVGGSPTEKLRITSDGFVGINEDNPKTGFTIGKFGDYNNYDGNTYYMPVGKWASAWNAVNALESNIDYWVGFVGGYHKSGNSVNICLAPNRGNLSAQQGMYISGEATGPSTSDFTVGKIIGGSALGQGTSGNVRATKSELFRITSGGYAELSGAADVRLTLGNAGTAGTNNANWIRGVNNNLYYNAATSDHLWEIGGAEHMRLDNSGNLFLRSESANYVVMGSSGDGTSGGVTNNMNWIRGNGNNTQYNTSGGFHAWEVSGAEKLRITSDGNVSITNGAFGGSGTAPKLNVVGTSGVMITHTNSTDRPTVGHTGNEPNITTFSNHFYNEVHRCITDFRSLCEGTYAGYILLVPAHPGSGNVSGKKFYGTIMCDRGSSGAGNSTQVAKIHASTAYSNSKFFVEIDRHSQFICGASKVTYSGTDYLAVRFNSGGGGPTHRTYIDGKHRGADANFLRVVRENEVTVVDKHFGSLITNPSGPPTCGVFIKNMTGSHYDNGVLKGGSVVYQYAPSGTNSPWNTSDGTFTAQVNGLYLVCGGLLVQTGTGRLEGKLEWHDGSNWQTYLNFNGTGTTYDGPTFTCMIPLKEGYALRISRASGNAYNSSHPQNYFGVHLLNGLMREDVPH